MAFRPEVFISATPVELDACREVVRRALLEMGAHPVEHRDFCLTHAHLGDALRQAIGRCDAVIHVAGWRYGAEPSERTLGAPRQSYAHCEWDMAQKLGRSIYSFLGAKDLPTHAMPAEDDDRRMLQYEHRARLERSGLPPPSFNTTEQLQQMVRALRPLIMARRAITRLPWPAMHEAFVGRRQALEFLHERVVPGSLTVLHPAPEGGGRGGDGTTTLAIEAAWRLHEAGKFPYVFFVPGGARSDIEAVLAGFSRSDALGLLPDEVAGHQARLTAVLDWFRGGDPPRRWLVILDAIDNAASWRTARTLLTDLGSGGAVVLTSRLTAWPGLPTFPLPPFSVEQAREFLLRRIPLMQAPRTAKAESMAGDRLADVLGRVPLALELAAGYLRDSEQGPSILFEAPGARSKVARKPPTFTELLERNLAELPAEARALFHQILCLAPAPATVPMGLWDHRGDWAGIRTILSRFERRGLVRQDHSAKGIIVHRTIRELVLDRLSAAEHTAALGGALASVEAALRKGNASLLREQLVPHCRALLGQLNGQPLELQAGGLVQRFAAWLQECGRAAEAEPFLRRALAIAEKQLGPSHPDLRARVRELASVLRHVGRLAEAEVLARRALRCSEAAGGAEHPDVAVDLAELAGCLRARNELDEAEKCYRRALRIEEHHDGALHPRVAIALNSLAGVLQARRRLREAEPLYRRACDIDDIAFGSTHPRTAARMHNLASALAGLHQLHEAAALSHRAIETDERTFGPHHAEMVPALRTLAEIEEALGRGEVAEAMYRRALAIEETLLGANHPEVAADLTNIGGILWDRGALEEAQPLLLRGVEILASQRSRHGRDHPMFVRAVANLRGFLAIRGYSRDEINAYVASLKPPEPRRERRMWMPASNE